MSVVDVLPPSPPATSSGSRKRLPSLFASIRTTNTPQVSPASDPESSSLTSKKRVEFSPWANIHHPSAPVTSLFDSSEVKSLPPSRECQSYIKSILKSSIQDEKQSPSFDGPADDKLSLNEVMESIVQQLSKNDNTESIDAYQTLASTIKAYNEIPDQAVLKSKLTTITRQIRQHLAAKERLEHQPGDINLITSALKVLVILVWNSEFEALLNDDFRSFILDRSISVIAERTAPKSVLVHYLHLLATQDFRPGLLTSNGRASRLIEALKGLTKDIKGNGVVSERLLVYQRLLDQARPVMKSRSTQWVEHMLSAMASNITDTRNKALALGRKACQAFPASSSISGSIRMALDLKQETGRTLGTSICRRLEKMVIGKDDAVQVPQIWAVILLLCNNSSMRIDAWPGLKEWLMVIQRCFNGSDTSLRLQANSAWNRFVYIARPHEASDSLVAMLLKPVAAQLERSASDKSSKASHAVAMSSYCNLLYYAFRPATTLSQYNRVWNEYVVKVMRSSFLEKSSGNADVASRILMTLFWDAKKTTKVWNENRAHENRLLEPEELPTIDCRWTRSRCSPILEVFQVLFRHSSWGFPGSQDQAYVGKAWRHFLKAIREAGSKEIKMSNETRAATVAILNFVTKLWHQQELLDHLTNISFVAISELGVERLRELGEGVEIGPGLTDAVERLLPYIPSLRNVNRDVVSGVEQDHATKNTGDVDEERQAHEPASSRKRHDDSQVHFVAIESSPPRAAAEDSQFLTDNQKEARDRQREEPAITFTDLRSSPRLQSRHSEPRDCGFARKAAILAERPTTPTIPEHNDAMDTLPEPSPTPKSRVLKRVSEVDVPSSPPSMQGGPDGADAEPQNVSSPVRDATEIEDQGVQLESPPKPSSVAPRAQNTNVEAEELRVFDYEDDRASQVPESAEAHINPEAANHLEEQAEVEAVDVETEDKCVAEASEKVTDNDELPSSPPKEAETRTATPPHRSSSVFNTDELNELSASQLSHDLDWSTVLEGLPTPPTASKSPRQVHGPNAFAEVVRPALAVPEEVKISTEQVARRAAHIDEAETIPPQLTQKKRKRPESGYADRKKKRRKPSRSQSQSTSSQVSYFKREQEEELLDCIEVDTSSQYLGSSSPLRQNEEEADLHMMSQSMEVQTDPTSQALNDTAVSQDQVPIVQGGLKRRGRPRKCQSQLKQEPTGPESGCEDVVQASSTGRQVPRSRSRRTSRNRMSVEVSAEPEPPRAQGVPYVLIPSVEVTVPTSKAAQPPNSGEEQTSDVLDAEQIQKPPQSVRPQDEVVATLQAALNQIKTAAPGSIDLRTVDELCFQIRFQAQNAAMDKPIE